MSKEAEQIVRLFIKQATPDQIHDLLYTIAELPAAETVRASLRDAAASIFYYDKE